METKFTKGKWIRTISPNGCNHIKCDGRRNGGYIISSTCGNDEVANAHLISCAPEMYEMIDKLSTELLHMIRAENSRLLQNISASDLDDPDWIDEESVYLAQKLLAKARGENAK